MKITPYKNREVNLEKEVLVYRCLNRRGHVYSIKQSGYVVGHTTEISLKDITFVVNPAGKKKAMAQKVRNVHAFIKGHITPELRSKPFRKITYKPFNELNFHIVGSDVEIKSCGSLTINENGVFI